jgi:hypothetical protein
MLADGRPPPIDVVVESDMALLRMLHARGQQIQRLDVDAGLNINNQPRPVMLPALRHLRIWSQAEELLGDVHPETLQRLTILEIAVCELPPALAHATALESLHLVIHAHPDFEDDFVIDVEQVAQLLAGAPRLRSVVIEVDERVNIVGGVEALLGRFESFKWSRFQYDGM